MISFSKLPRSGLVVITGMLLLMVFAQIIGLETFRYQLDWFESVEYWRILSAHWVHVNWIHLALNALGLILCFIITGPGWSIRRWMAYQISLACGISLMFTFYNPYLQWYVGYSGILYGIFLLAAIDLYQQEKLVALLLAVGIVTKIALEQFGDFNLTSSDIIGAPVIVDAHLYGVFLAIVIALVNRVIKMRRST